MVEKILKMYTVAGNSPECPSCGNWNAMLDRRGIKDGLIFEEYDCRDCGFSIPVDAVEMVLRTWERINGIVIWTPPL